jgi:hypothetical protein
MTRRNVGSEDEKCKAVYRNGFLGKRHWVNEPVPRRFPQQRSPGPSLPPYLIGEQWPGTVRDGPLPNLLSALDGTAAVSSRTTPPVRARHVPGTKPAAPAYQPRSHPRAPLVRIRPGRRDAGRRVRNRWSDPAQPRPGCVRPAKTEASEKNHAGHALENATHTRHDVSFSPRARSLPPRCWDARLYRDAGK